MRYAELIKNPLPEIPEFIRIDKDCYTGYYHAEVLNTKKDGAVLAITFFGAYGNENEPYIKFRHFFNGTEHVTENMRKHKKCTGTIGYCIDNSCYYRKINIRAIDGSFDIIMNYLKGNSINADISSIYFKFDDKAITIIEACECEISRIKLAEKHKKIADLIDKRMECVGELPDDFEEWIDNSVQLNHRFFFYNYVKSKSNNQRGYCSHCENVFEAKSVKLNNIVSCPECRSVLVCKSLKKITRSILSFKNVAYLETHINQYGKKFIVERIFSAFWTISGHKKGPGEIKVEKSISEIARKFYYADTLSNFPDEKGCHTYYYETFKSTDKTRWCNETRTAGVSCFQIYPCNIQEIINDTVFTRMINIDFAEITKHVNCNGIIEIIDALKKYPVLESLVKCGAYNLSRYIFKHFDYIGSNNILDEFINKKATKAKDFLRVDKIILGKFAEIDITPNQYVMYQKLIKINPRLTWDLFTEYIKIKAEKFIDEFNIILEKYKITDYWFLKYIKAQKKISKMQYEEIVIEWRDYLDMAVKLKIEFTQAVKFSKNLHTEHDRLVSLLDDEKNAKKNKALKKRLKILKTFVYQNKKFVIAPLTSYSEFIKESTELSHCVKSYIDKCAEGKTNIFGLRSIACTDKPYFTVELKNNGTIAQNHGKRNCAPSADVKRFVNEWVKKVVKPNIELLNNGSNNCEKIKIAIQGG